MGKNIIQQKRGKGSPTYRSPSFNFVAKASHRVYDERERTDKVTGVIADFVHCPGHSSPLMRIRFGSDDVYAVAPEGLKVGTTIESGATSAVATGNSLPLKNIPLGTPIHNIESNPGDGGKFVRSSGSFARVVLKQPDKITVMLPSKKKKEFLPLCRAAIGVVAGGGRLDKPLIKAGANYHKKRAKNKLYPIVSAVAMNAVDHAYGGSRTSKKNMPTIAPRFAPPGAKVGKLWPRRTGKKR